MCHFVIDDLLTLKGKAIKQGKNTKQNGWQYYSVVSRFVSFYNLLLYKLIVYVFYFIIVEVDNVVFSFF